MRVKVVAHLESVGSALHELVAVAVAEAAVDAVVAPMTDCIVHCYSEAAVAFPREMLGSLPARPCSGIGLRACEIAGSVVLSDMNNHNHIQDT